MSVLRGTEKDVDVVSRLDLLNPMKEASEEEKRAVDVRLEKWKKFLDSETGRNASSLIRPELELCNFRLGLSLVEFCSWEGVSPDAEPVRRAEIRGERAVWMRLLREPEELERRLMELETLEGRGRKKSVGWEAEKKS